MIRWLCQCTEQKRTERQNREWVLSLPLSLLSVVKKAKGKSIKGKLFLSCIQWQQQWSLRTQSSGRMLIQTHSSKVYYVLEAGHTSTGRGKVEHKWKAKQRKKYLFHFSPSAFHSPVECELLFYFPQTTRAKKSIHLFLPFISPTFFIRPSRVSICANSSTAKQQVRYPLCHLTCGQAARTNWVLATWAYVGHWAASCTWN